MGLEGTRVLNIRAAALVFATSRVPDTLNPSKSLNANGLTTRALNTSAKPYRKPKTLSTHQTISAKPQPYISCSLIPIPPNLIRKSLAVNPHKSLKQNARKERQIP